MRASPTHNIAGSGLWTPPTTQLYVSPLLVQSTISRGLARLFMDSELMGIMSATHNLACRISWFTLSFCRPLHVNCSSKNFSSLIAIWEVFGCTMPALSSLFKYWLFASAFTTIYIMLGALLESYAGFKALYDSWADCIVISGYGRDVAPVVRSTTVAILALLFLRVQTNRSLFMSSFLLM